MGKGKLVNFMTFCALAMAPACGDDGSSAGSGGTDSGTDETDGDEQSSTESGEAEAEGESGDGDGDSGDGDGDSGDGDGDSGDGDGDSGDGDGDSGDGDGDTGDGDGDTGDGDGDTGDGDGDTGDGDGDPDLCGTTLYSTVRDFQSAHPDFQSAVGVDPGIVQQDLGMDLKPVYNGNPSTPTTTTEANFNQWYNDVDGVNQNFEVPIELQELQPGLYEYANNMFFPIDDQGWGNEGNPHNYHFTLELHTKFLYQGGEVFGFEGDDDLWVFVNGQLGIDLGGVHGPLSGNIDMDAQADDLGLQIGQVYDLDFFFAERHTTQSNFKITTTIACFDPQ
ncbi:PA14 domain protein [Enhygromyxa salina]|uniref:PA14 domain protein n=1 Tax=Enhygromyxa salina TaxID=215803 RepID=A0A2S9YAI7_9BACT|nr:fibro-slime domain-containing protein [Enhygromyxa salina]PRQ02128.1 PA14 domain protein [Enhygromyxa salina]